MTIIGINLMPVAMNYLAGGEEAKNYGDTKNLILGGVTLLIILILQRFTKGFLKSIAILIGLAIGTALAGIFGMVDIKQVGGAHWFGFLCHSDFLASDLMSAQYLYFSLLQL